MLDQATRMTARVAPYIEAIRKARDAGFTWADIARAIGAQDGETVRRAVRICKYKAEQIPLPEPQTQRAPARSVSTQPPGTSPATGKKLFDSLPKIGGNTP